MSARGKEPEQMEAGDLARYIAERISLSNYDEARRATEMLAARLDPDVRETAIGTVRATGLDLAEATGIRSLGAGGSAAYLVQIADGRSATVCEVPGAKVTTLRDVPTRALVLLHEGVRDAIVDAHVAGQDAGRARVEPALRELVRVCVSMDAELPDSRCDESEYRAAMHRAADALGEPLPAALLATWGEQ